MVFFFTGAALWRQLPKCCFHIKVLYAMFVDVKMHKVLLKITSPAYGKMSF